MRSERERLLDILEFIEQIEKYANRGKDTFLQDELIQNWMVNHISMIGEACRAIPDDFQSNYANIPWADIVAMRNLLVHHYFGIDLEAVWSVVSVDIPKLNVDIQSVLHDLDKIS